MDTAQGRDTLIEHAEEFDFAAEDSAIEAPPAIGGDERRMHVRAYNYWASLLGNRALPSIEDLEPADIEDFGPHGVLLDFTAGVDDPAVAYLGSALRRECEIDGPISHISEVPPRSLLSRLTDHYLQILANAAPIGFEAEFVNQRGIEIMYRGILMPFSSDDDTIDFVYGVINWKEVASPDLTDELTREVGAALRSAPHAIGVAHIWADGPSAVPEEDVSLGSMPLNAEAALADWLALARDSAEEARSSDARSRTALYRAIGLAYDFAVAAAEAPDDYAEMLEDAGIVAQDRSPMTAVVKLIFGAHYDKTRLTEYAAALSHARALDMPAGSLAPYLENYDGGLKGLIRDVRAARRTVQPEATTPIRKARAKLIVTAALREEDVATDTDGLAVVVARREADGTLSIVAALPQDSTLTGRVYTAAIGAP